MLSENPIFLGSLYVIAGLTAAIVTMWSGANPLKNFFLRTFQVTFMSDST